MLLYFLSKYLPFSRRSKIAFCSRLTQLLKEGVSVVHAFQNLKENLLNPRLRVTSSILYERMKMGAGLLECMNEFPLLFDKNLRSAIEASNVTNSSLALYQTIEIYIELSKMKGKFLKETLIPNIPSLVLAAGVYSGIYYNTKTTLVPLYRFIIAGKIFDMPGGLKIHILTFYAFNNIIIPIGLAIALIPVVTMFLNLPFLKIITDFISCYLPPFNWFLSVESKLAFISLLVNLTQSGLSLQQSLVIAKTSIKNYFLKKNLNASLDLLHKGNSFASSFKNSKLISSIDKDSIFASKEDLPITLQEIKERFIIRMTVMRKVTATLIRLFCIFFSIFWITSFILAWFGLILTYMVK